MDHVNPHLHITHTVKGALCDWPRRWLVVGTLVGWSRSWIVAKRCVGGL